MRFADGTLARGAPPLLLLGLEPREERATAMLPGGAATTAIPARAPNRSTVIV
jgi:hypothetical protein